MYYLYSLSGCLLLSFYVFLLQQSPVNSYFLKLAGIRFPPFYTVSIFSYVFINGDDTSQNV